MLPTVPQPELVIAVRSPIGTDNTRTLNLAAKAVSSFGYSTHHIKVTELMKKIKVEGQSIDTTDVGTRYDTRIRYANQLRELFEMQYVLAVVCIAAIRAYRRLDKSSDLIGAKQRSSLINLKGQKSLKLYDRFMGAASLQYQFSHVAINASKDWFIDFLKTDRIPGRKTRISDRRRLSSSGTRRKKMFHQGSVCVMPLR